jgi:hypothetical protein
VNFPHLHHIKNGTGSYLWSGQGVTLITDIQLYVPRLSMRLAEPQLRHTCTSHSAYSYIELFHFTRTRSRAERVITWLRPLVRVYAEHNSRAAGRVVKEVWNWRILKQMWSLVSFHWDGTCVTTNVHAILIVSRCVIIGEENVSHRICEK